MKIFVILLLTGLAVGCKLEAEPAPKQTAPAASAPPVIRLSSEALQAADLGIEVIQVQPYKRTLRVPGIVKPNPNRLVDVSSLIPGRTIEVLVNIGDHARPGLVLAHVNSTELGLAQSEFLKAQARLTVAKKGLERARRLLEAKVIGTGEYQRREGETLAAQAEYRAGFDRLILFGMTPAEIETLARAQRIQSKAAIRSPLEGTVIERHVDPGEVIDTRTKLFVIADLQRVWLLADVQEKDIPLIQLGQPVEIQVSPYPDEVFRGVIVHIREVIDPATRTVKVRTEVPNPDGRLKPEMFATVKIQTTAEEHVLTVPSVAVQRDRGREIVFVQAGPGEFMPREVTLGEPSGDRIPVVKGLTEGEQVVTKGAFILKSELHKEQMEPA